MKFFEKLQNAMKQNRSLVCVGLDPDFDKLPEAAKRAKYPIFEFNRSIIDATRDLVCCYKPQIAYYSGQGADGELKMSIEYIHETAPDIPVILDAKRGDIGSTASMYAREVFERYHADAVTVNPYMGFDTLKPFLDYEDKGVVVLCRTSNPAAGELQNLVCDGKKLYEHVAELARDRWNYNDNIALVIGATCPEELKHVRELCPDMTFLVPGVGAQGGDAAAVMRCGCRADGMGVIVNSSRGIIYAGKGDDFAECSARAATELRDLLNANRVVAR